MTTQPRRVLDLRQTTKPAPPAPPAAKPARPATKPAGEWVKAGLRVGMPIPVGSAVRVLSDGEQLVIDKLGITAGDLPPNLAAEIQKIVQSCPELWADGLPDGVDPNRAPLPPLTEIPLENLPPQKQKYIIEFVEQYRNRIEQDREAVRNYNPAAPPGVNDAIRIGNSSQASYADIVDDLEPGGAKPSSAAQPSYAAPPPAAPPAPPPAAPYSPEQEDFKAGGSAALTHCPHCEWDLKNTEDDLKLTDSDKLAFKAAMLTGDRFRKSYSLLGGSLVVGFRDLTASESDLALRQVVADTRTAIGQRDLPEEATLWGNLATYRLAMGLDFIDREGQRVEMPEINDPHLQLDPAVPPDTRVAPFHTAIVGQYLPSDSLRAIVGDQYHMFGLYLRKLRVSAHSPNF